jgi:hypothetical protein
MRTSALQIANRTRRRPCRCLRHVDQILGISGSAPLQLAPAQVPEGANAPQSTSSMKANPVGLNTDILIRILEEAL